MATGGIVSDGNTEDEIGELTSRVEKVDLTSAGYVAFILNSKGKEYRQAQTSSDFQERLSADKDAEYFKNVFVEQLGLEWINEEKYENFTVTHWDHATIGDKYEMGPRDCCLRCNILSRNYSMCKFFVLVASSHGLDLQEPMVLMSDDQFVMLSEITDALRDEKLAAVTKIVILQCCRTSGSDQDSPLSELTEGAVGGVTAGLVTDKKDDNGLNIEVQVEIPHQNEGAIVGPSGMTDDLAEDLSNSPPGASSGDPGRNREPEVQSVNLREPPLDFLIVYATTKGRRAYNNEQKGSWMFNAMDEVAKKYDMPNSELHFLKFLTETNGRVCERETRRWKRDSAGQIKRTNDGQKEVNEKERFKNTMCVAHRLRVEPVFNLDLARSLANERKLKEQQSIPPHDILWDENITSSTDGKTEESQPEEEENLFKGQKKKKKTKKTDI